MRSYYYVDLISIKIFSDLCPMPSPLTPFAGGFSARSPDVEANLPPTAPPLSFDSPYYTLKIEKILSHSNMNSLRMI